MKELVLREVRLQIPGKWIFEVTEEGEFKVISDSQCTIDINWEETKKLQGEMKSYFVIIEDRETGEIDIRVKLLKEEMHNLYSIRHLIVERITQILDPEVKRITFKL